jgi:hypothetical protein
VVFYLTLLNICLNVLGMILIRFGCCSIETAILSVIFAVIIEFIKTLCSQIFYNFIKLLYKVFFNLN